MADIHFNCKKQRSFAWAKYYQEVNNRVEDAGIIMNVVPITLHKNGEVTPKNELPTHITQEFYDMAVELRKTFSCPVCLDMVSKETIEITYCGHIYCKPCLKILKSQPEGKCAVCRKKFHNVSLSQY